MSFLIDGPEDAVATLVLAHGAGGAMDTPFMNTFARAVADKGIRVVRFEFPYMRARREGKRTGAPDRQPVLLDSWRETVREVATPNLFVGGKSLGGRMASMVADEIGARGLVCLGYPFHPPGKPERLRVEHLRSLRTPALILQGTRDPFGSREEVAGYGLAPTIRVEWVPDGDHSFRPRRNSGASENGNLVFAAERTTAFIHSQD